MNQTTTAIANDPVLASLVEAENRARKAHGQAHAAVIRAERRLDFDLHPCTPSAAAQRLHRLRHKYAMQTATLIALEAASAEVRAHRAAHFAARRTAAAAAPVPAPVEAAPVPAPAPMDADNAADLIRTLLLSALACLNTGDLDTGLKSAAWRVADAGLLLRRAIPDEGWIAGVTVATGRGALLPK